MRVARRILSAFVLTMIALVAAAAAHGQAAVIPFVEGSGTWPVVKLQIGPGTSGNFLVDTGSSLCLITDAFVGRCSLAVKPLTDDLKQAVAGFPCTGYVDTKIAGVGPRDRVVRFMVMPSSFIPRFGMAVDGLLGNDLLSQAPAMFDFELRKVFLWDKPGVDERTLTALGMSGPDVYKTALHRDNKDIYSVDARINDALTLRMVLDTGINVSIVPDAEAKRLHFKSYLQGATVTGVDGATHGDAYVLDKVALGLLDLYDVPVFGMPAKSTLPSDHVFGQPVLQLFRIFLDPQAAEIRLKPVAAVPRQPEPTPQASTGPKYTWKPQYKPGQSFTTLYVHTVVSDKFKDNNVHKSIDTWHERYTVNSVQVDGTTTINVTVLDATSEIDGQRSEPVTIPKGKNSATLTFSPRGELTGGWEHSQQGELMRELSYFRDCVSPPRAVAVGDSWHALVKSRAHAGKTIDETWTLESAAPKDGKTLLTARVKAEFAYEADTPQVVSVDGSFIIDQRSGLLKSRHIVFGNVPVDSPKFPDEVAIGTITVDETPEGEPSKNAAGASP